MGDLLPGRRDDDRPDEPRVVGIDGDDADEVLSALSAGTAREILSSLHEEPATASEIAGRVDTTLQNTQYHLDSLTDAGLVVERDTVYSEKGREMSVYGPADRALVVIAGDEEDTGGLRGVLRRLLGTLLPLGGAAVAAELSLGGPFAPAAGGDGGESASETAETVGTATPSANDAVGVAETTATPAVAEATGDRRCSTVSPPRRV
ncbi:MAG: bacterial regulatory protein, arsR family, partial [halophilic archaeon J07HB67]